MNTPTLIRGQKVRKILNISPSTEYRWGKAGILKPIKPGGKNSRIKLYALADILKLLD